MFDDIDPRSPTPLYEQIAARIRVAMAADELKAGTMLPSVRKLSAELRVNPATVVQAYRDLEREGFVTMKHGSGTFVNEISVDRRAEEQSALALELVRKMLMSAARLGIGPADIAAAFSKEVGVGVHD